MAMVATCRGVGRLTRVLRRLTLLYSLHRAMVVKACADGET